jgi:PAS domain S-box-containing protein
MAQRIREYPWSATPLGDLGRWSPSLQTLVNVMLASRQPMFLVWGPQHVWFHNDAFIPILGRKHPAALGRHALDQVWSEARDVLAPLFAKVFAGEAVQMDDLSIELDRRGRLEEAHFTFSYTPVAGAPGEVCGLFGVCTETTELIERRRHHKVTEKALQEAADAATTAAERIDLILRAGAVMGSWIWDIPGDRVIADEQFARSFGLDLTLCRAGLSLDRLMALVHSADRSRVAEEIAAAVGRGGTYRSEHRVLPMDGEYRWAETSGELEVDETGAALRLSCVLIDIEARRRAQDALHTSNALLRTFMEAVPGVIYAKDREGRLLIGNAGTARLLGKSFDEFIGRTDLELLDDAAEAQAVMANDRRIMATGVAEQIEEQVTSPDGTSTWWLSTKVPLRSAEGEIIGLVGTSIDITARRRAEQQRALLVNELNHRVRNTLTVVHGIARQTFREPAALGQLEKFGARLIALSRAHNLLTDQNWAAANLRDVVGEQLGSDSLGERISLEGPEVFLSPAVSAGLALVLHELCTNATKYGALSHGSGQVRISWRLVSETKRVKLRWAEIDGPPVVAPERRGFGTKLIERALAAEEGRVTLHFLSTGVVCEVEAPVAAESD